MHRIPEKQKGSQTVSDCAQSRFYQFMQITHTLLLTYHQTEISWLFFPTFLFALYHCIFLKAEFFHMNLCFQKDKTLRKIMCVYTTTAIHNYLFRFTFLPLHANSPSSSRFRWRQKCCLWFLGCLHFGAPCLELFWLSRFFKLCFRLHFNLWKLIRNVFEKLSKVWVLTICHQTRIADKVLNRLIH